MQNKVDVILNPVRIRVIQYVAHNQPVTVAQIAKALPDVSKATLYRHMRILTENGILQVVGAEKIRGTFEQSYSLNKGKINATGQESRSELQALVYSMLTKLIAEFTEYFSRDLISPVKDKLFLSTNTFSLDNDDFDSFTQEVFAIIEKYSQFPVKENSKTRLITVVSSPAPQEETEE
jgi:DNA-binding transcriptional ArsR family regulator